MSFFGGGFSTPKVKAQLKMACHRLALSSNKKTAMVKNQVREIAKLLAEEPAPQEEKAKIRAEHLIREDDTIEAYEILQLSCELLSERMQLIANNKECPPDLVGVISTILWCSARVEIPELATLRKQFRSKYGKEFEERAMMNKDGVLNERVVGKLTIQPPSPDRVLAYLERIAQECDVQWEPSAAFRAQQKQMGWSVPTARGTGFGGDVSVPLTGQEQEVQYQEFGGGGGGASTIPPPAASSSGSAIPPPSAPGAFSMPGPAPSNKPGKPGNNNNNNDFGGDGDLPTAVAYVPPPPPAPTRGVSDLSGGEEVDIYVPAAPSAPPTSGGGGGGGGGGGPGKGLPPVAPSSFRARGQQDFSSSFKDDRDDGASATTGMSYDDLTNRFAQLKK